MTAILFAQGDPNADPAKAWPMADTGEREYSPGLTPMLVEIAGDTPIYTAPAGKAFRVRAIDAVPVVRGLENAPVIVFKILNSDNTLFRTFYILGAISKRKPMTGPIEGKAVIELDIAARVPVTLDIEEFTP